LYETWLVLRELLTVWKGVDEGGQGKEATHNALIITEEDEADACQGSNGIVETLPP